MNGSRSYIHVLRSLDEEWINTVLFVRIAAPQLWVRLLLTFNSLQYLVL